MVNPLRSQIFPAYKIDHSLAQQNSQFTINKKTLQMNGESLFLLETKILVSVIFRFERTFNIYSDVIGLFF